MTNKDPLVAMLALAKHSEANRDLKSTWEEDGSINVDKERHRGFTASEIAEFADVSSETARRRLKKWTDHGLVEKEGKIGHADRYIPTHTAVDIEKYLKRMF